MKKYYSTTVQELGANVHAFAASKMLIMFNENAPDELREYCVLHRGNALTDTVTAGDTFYLGQTPYKIVYVGSEVQKNLGNLGHITLRFNNNEEGITVSELRAGYKNTKTTPLGRSGKLTEVADTVLFLASDHADYIHGVTYNVAGGKTRG